MLDIALKTDLIELLARNLKTEQIEELGRRILNRNLNIYDEANEYQHVTLPPRRAADTLVQACQQHNVLNDLIQLLVELDGHLLLGRWVTVEGLERLLEDLPKVGLVYNFQKRKVMPIKSDPQELPNWGSLRDGRTYSITVASIDIVENSQLVRTYGMRKVQNLYSRFYTLLNEKLRKYDGRTWSWSGDGGIVAFTFKHHELRAVQFAFELQRTLPIFNSFTERGIDAEIAIRIGIDAGKIQFTYDIGSIVSETINFAAHLEKQATSSGHIAVSDTVCEALPLRLAVGLSEEDTFEGRTIYHTPARLDVLR